MDISLTDKQLRRQHEGRMKAFPEVIRLANSNALLLFCDEAVFTSKQFDVKVWYARREKLNIKKKKLGFGAIAVVSAINMQGQVVASVLRDKSIDSDAFCEFLRLIRRKSKSRKCHMLVDNLSVHRTPDVTNQATRSRINLIFNGTYSSSYNPIEQLWAYSKRRFQSLCIEEG